MDMTTVEEVTTVKRLVEELTVPLRAFRRVYATLEHTPEGPACFVHSPFIGAVLVTTVTAGIEHGRKSESARKQGRLPRELRIATG